MKPAPSDTAPPGGAAAYAAHLAQAGGCVERSLFGARTNTISAALYASPPYDLVVPGLPVSRLSINLTSAPLKGSLDGEPPRCHDARRLSLYLTPAHASARWIKAAPSRHLNLYFESGTVHGIGHSPILNGSGPTLRPLVDALVAELQTADSFAPEAADSLGRLILIRLLRQVPRAGALDPRRMARVREYVAAHLHEPLRVGDLAAVCGMSPSRFAMAFTRLTGQPPHRFVVARRVAHAVALLARPGPRLAEVADACGFSSQQHLTATLRRHLGTTPGRVRQAAERECCPAAGPAAPSGQPAP